ncbi:MAG: prepilin-type N-terminal cleavage/methylation domain-containing protein [Patescibacteria group bacterium]
MRTLRSSKGFTLIELLIVIVIIGILAGVLIAVINPATQQNRARDAGVKAGINKVALATEGFISAYGEVPDEVQFIAALSNVTESGTSCSTANSYDCMFTITGNPLPVLCSGTAPTWSGSGAVQCSFRYLAPSGAGSVQFQIFGKSHGIVDTIFRYDNTVGEIQDCDNAGTNCS